MMMVGPVLSTSREMMTNTVLKNSVEKWLNAIFFTVILLSLPKTVKLPQESVIVYSKE